MAKARTKKPKGPTVEDVFGNKAMRAFDLGVEAEFANHVCSVARPLELGFKCGPGQVAIYEEAMRISPHLTQFYAAKLGEQLFYAEKGDRAMEALKRAVAASSISNPNFERPLHLVHNMMSVIYLSQGKPDEALQELSKAPVPKFQGEEYRDAGVDLQLAYALLLKRDFPRALETVRDNLGCLDALSLPPIELCAHNIAIHTKAIAETEEARERGTGRGLAMNSFYQRMQGAAKKHDSLARFVYSKLSEMYFGKRDCWDDENMDICCAVIDRTPANSLKNLKDIVTNSYHNMSD